MNDQRTEAEQCGKFPELRKTEGGNNYGSWIIKAKRKLATLELWDYVADDNATPPRVPALLPGRIIRGPDTQGNQVEVHLPGNQVAFEVARAATTPWQKKNKQVRDFITNAVGDDLLYLVKKTCYISSRSLGLPSHCVTTLKQHSSTCN